MGTRWLRPRMVLLAWLLGVVVAQGQKSPIAHLPTLTQVEQIRRMNIEEAGRGYPVRLRAVVTYYNWDLGDLFIQDSTAGIWVNPGQTKLALHQGEWVEVEGSSGVGELAPDVEPTHFRNLGEAPMPNPRKPTSDELASGRLDSQWVELQGVVRSVVERDGGLVLNVSSGAFECSVFVLNYPSLPTDIVDAQIRVRGVFAGLYDPSSIRVIGFHVLVPSWSDVEVLEKPTQAFWSAPLRPIRLLLRLTPQDAFTHRVRVRGVVTLQQLGRFLCLRDREGALRVNTTQPTPVKVGDVIDAMGYPAIGDYTVIMRDAIFRRVEGGPPPEPVVVSPEELRAGNHNADLVRLAARLLNCTTRPGEEVLELQAGQVTFRAALNTATNGSPLGTLRVGSLLQLTGVWIIEADENHEAKDFEILLRSPADVVVFGLPSWWTARRIAWLLIILAGIVVWISFWVAVLRRRVEERTETIRATLESTADGIQVVNSAGEIVAYNRKFAEMWRIPESVLAPRDDNAALNFVLSQLRDPDAFLTRVRQTYADHDAQTDDVIEFKDGRVFERHSEPQRVKGKNVGRVWGFRDVTERRRAEEEVRAGRQRLLDIIDFLPDATFVIDRDKKVIAWNRAIEEMTGVRKEGILGQGDYAYALPFYGERRPILVDLLGAEDWELKTKYKSVTKRGSSLYAEAYVPSVFRGRGGHLWVTASPLLDSQGNRVGGIESLRDITERKQAEQALLASEEKFAKAFRSSPNAMAISTLEEGRFLDVNDAFVRMIGHQREDVLGRTALELGIWVNPEDRVRIADELREVGQVSGREVLLRGRSGQLRPSLFFAETIEVRGTRCLLSATVDITERKRAEEALQLTAHQLAQAMDMASLAHWELDTATMMFTFNDRFYALYGTTAEREGGYQMSAEAYAREFLCPDDVHIVTDSIAKRLVSTDADTASTLEHRIRRRDGETRHVVVRISVTKDSEGRIIKNRGVNQDITERKRAEEALIEERHLLRTLMDNLPDHIYFKDRESRFIRGNTALANWIGLADPTQLLGKTDFDIFSDEHARQAYADEQEVIRTGRPVLANEEKETWLDGRETWVSTTKMPLRDAQGRISGTFGISRDITARKQAEEALRESEERLRGFIENVPVGVYRTTPDGRVLMANPALLRMLGYDSLQELASRNLERGGFEAGYPRTAFGEQLDRQGEARGLEATWKRRDGTLVFVRESTKVVRAEDGRVLYYDGTIEDVTERRRLEEQLRLAQKMEAVGRLAAGVAHDFNNLLTIVIGFSDLALQRLSAGNRMRPPLEEIRKAGERAAWLTRQLLAFSRKQVLQPQILELNSLLANVDQMLRRVIGEDIELAMHLPPGLGRVKADPGQIEQVIMNLAVNARDAMPQGGQLTLEAANVELDSGYASSHQSVLPGHYVMFAMSDTGIGMDVKTQAHIFEPFFTTKEPGKGTGLGLSTVYGIVKQSGGYIWVYSEPGKVRHLRSTYLESTKL
jgi:PAS domain S-box-containing protein